MAERRNPGIQVRRSGDGSISYRAQIRMRGFAHLSKTFTRKTDAKQWIENTRAAIRGGNAPATEAQRTTLREALERYLREITPTKKGAVREQSRVKAWKENPLALRFLSQLRGEDFAKYRDARRAQGRAENTIAIELKLISSVYKLAATEWRMEGLKNPIKGIAMPAPSNERKPAPLDADKEKALLKELARCGPMYAPLASLAIESAMRQGELLGLAWRDLDLQKRVAHLKDTKNSEPRDVPLSSRAVAVLKALPRPLDATSKVFPLAQSDVIRTFARARKAAGFPDLHFHDLRHEAVRRLCKVLNMQDAMRVTGHKTPSMLMRYYHPEAEDLAKKLA